MAETANYKKCYSCDNDARAMDKHLKDIGYEVTLLIDSEGTRKRILDELTRLASVTEAGELVTVYFSGHGGQKFDDNNDESDGWDETWVVYDGEILDDEIRAVWSSFKAGARVFFISDSCNSGTVLKNQMQFASSRSDGAYWAVNPAKVVKAVPPSEEDVKLHKQALENNGFVIPFPVTSTPEDVSCTIISFAGCEDGKSSYMGTVYSVFTEKLLGQWSNGNFRGTYQAFFDAVAPKVTTDRSDQLPQIKVWGGDDPEFPASIPFRNIKAYDGISILPGNVVTIPGRVPSVPNSGAVFKGSDTEYLHFEDFDGRSIQLPREVVGRLDNVWAEGTQEIESSSFAFSE
jgi:hypothetical protein